MLYWLTDGANDIALVLKNEPTLDAIRDEVRYWFDSCPEIDAYEPADLNLLVARVAEELDEHARIAPDVLAAARAARGIS